MEKALGETQTLRAGCSYAEPKIFAPPQTPLVASAVVIHYEEALYQVYGPLPLPFTFFRGAGRPKFNPLEIVTTFTYKPSLVRSDARNFELS